MIPKSDFRLENPALTMYKEDRPYGRCIGQVGGTSYPCTQVGPEDGFARAKTAKAKTACIASGRG